MLALALFPGVGYLRVWGKMTPRWRTWACPARGEGAAGPAPSSRPGPGEALFESVAVPLASPRTPGVAYRGLRTGRSTA